MSTTATRTARDVYQDVRRYSEHHNNKETAHYHNMSVNDAHAQGDLTIIFIGDQLPEGVELVTNPSPQLVPGTTQGSRHVLLSLDGLTIYRDKEPHPLLGPIIDARHKPNMDHEGMTVTHPEHAWAVFHQPGVYRTRRQRAASEELRAVKD